MRSEQNQEQKPKLDSSLTRAILALALRAIRYANVRARSRARSRWNDERKSKDTGFQLAIRLLKAPLEARGNDELKAEAGFAHA